MADLAKPATAALEYRDKAIAFLQSGGSGILRAARFPAVLREEPYCAVSPQVQDIVRQRHAPGVLNPYWDVVRLLPGEEHWGELTVDGFPIMAARGDALACLEAGVTRNQLVRRYAWSICSPGDLQWMVGVLGGRGVVEVGAGNGYWSWMLAQAGVDVKAYDQTPPGRDSTWYADGHCWYPVYKADHRVAALFPQRALLLVWPPYATPMAQEALHAYGGDLLLLAGEGYGGCTGDDLFWRELARDWEVLDESAWHVTYSGIHCRLRALRRMAVLDAPGTPVA